ncbi:class I SAM-dependent methyltransferase [Aquimarina sp. 2201CG5-10]|uniref:class I SAM-dependent DNA methyltransferase n=1 Tax=Aquimarina callyspongiae TaxID=3098150 RepID=UPI002AB3DD7B|nr:class I SAM-dependent methyltransferase [Aquimarina sp. 2201CG5-10]MDY8137371.1 class I SAM-dependent methyltransferase [Aquimarina sp. 2201CG5-10]
MDKTKIAIEIFDNFAQEYQDKYMDQSMYEDSFNVFCDLIFKQQAKVLEIACGPGNITRYLLKKRPDFKILGIDLSSKMIELAKINNPTAHFQIMDCRKIKDIDQKYDAIMCGFCLPYLEKEDAKQLIYDVFDLLENNGVFYISTMEDDYNKSGLEGPSSGGEQKMYIHYHEEEYLIETIKNSGFKIMDVRYKDYPEKIDSSMRDLLIIARK